MMRKFMLTVAWSSMLIIACLNKSVMEESNETSQWDLAKEIENNVRKPNFPDRQFTITDYGAEPNNLLATTAAFDNAITECSAQGGGQVIVPQGIYITGPIHLQDNVNLHLQQGAEIRFSTNTADYLPVVHTSFEGTELMNYSPLIYAFGKKNIAITGSGILNGQASNTHWWPWSGKETYGWIEGSPSQHDTLSRLRLIQLAEDGAPVHERSFGNGSYLRPAFIQLFECQNVLIEGVKIINSPFWNIHPIKSQSVLIDGVTVESHGPNNDGCNPEYSKDVVIKNCIFNTGDDCIAIKSGRNADGRRVGIPSERIVVKDCQMIDGHGGVVMGSEISAGVRNVFVENCRMDSPQLDRAIRIKTNTKRGGIVENIHVRNLEIGQVREAVLKVNLHYATYADQEGSFLPEVRNIFLSNIQVENGGKYGILIAGREESPVQSIQLSNVTIASVEYPYKIDFVENLTLTDCRMNGQDVKYGE